MEGADARNCSNTSSSDKSVFQAYAANADFLHAAFARTEHPAKSDLLIIGDGLTSDIQGGVVYGIDTCWYNHPAEPQIDGLPITIIRSIPNLFEYNSG